MHSLVFRKDNYAFKQKIGRKKKTPRIARLSNILNGR